MRASLILSLILHGLILAMALIGFTAQDRRTVSQPVPVEIIASANLNEVKAGKPDQKAETALPHAPPVEKRSDIVETAADLGPTDNGASRKQAALPPPKPQAPPHSEAEKPAEEKSERPSDADAAHVTKAASVPTPEKRKDAPRPRQENKAREAHQTKPERAEQEPKHRQPPREDRIADLIDRPAPPVESKSDFDPKRIAALLNRDPTAGERPPEEAPRRPWRQPSTLEDQALGAAPAVRDREARGAPDRRDARMSADEVAAFRAQISRCWSPPAGGLGGDAIIVKLRLVLNENGTLGRPPELANDFNSPFFRPAADSAIRAVIQCQPYRMPPEKYGQWRDMLLTFDPSRMYGG